MSVPAGRKAFWKRKFILTKVAAGKRLLNQGTKDKSKEKKSASCLHMPTISMLLLRVEWCQRPSDVTRLHPCRIPQEYIKDTTLAILLWNPGIWMAAASTAPTMTPSAYFLKHSEDPVFSAYSTYFRNSL